MPSRAARGHARSAPSPHVRDERDETPPRQGTPMRTSDEKAVEDFTADLTPLHVVRRLRRSLLGLAPLAPLGSARESASGDEATDGLDLAAVEPRAVQGAGVDDDSR